MHTGTGSTPLGMYRNLVKYYQEGKLSFKYVKTFNMDEYVGLPNDHKESYHYFMYENLFKHIDIDQGGDYCHMCMAYSNAIGCLCFLQPMCTFWMAMQRI